MAQTILDSTTQQFLDIYDITNDLVIMKDGTTSVIITVDAMNFGLLAEEEQDAVMYAYAGLLNSLNYPIQIIIRSQTKDVTGYLQRLKDQEDAAQTRQNQTRIARYREFVANLIHERNVLDKKFYVVIPANGLELGLLTAQSVLPGSKTFDVSLVEKTVIIEKAKNLLEPKRDHIISQFARIGLYSRQLNTQEIIQLFYISYNPEASEGQGIDDSRSYTTPLVKASIESPAMINATANPMAPTAPIPVEIPNQQMAAPAASVAPISADPAIAPTMPMDVQPVPAVSAPTMPAPMTPTVPLTPSMPTMSPTPTEIPVTQGVVSPVVAPTVAPVTEVVDIDPNIQAVINNTLGALPAADITASAPMADTTNQPTTPIAPSTTGSTDSLPPLPEI